MNFLAHLYLSPADPDVMFGNFIADSVKGRAYDGFSPAVRIGIKLHRFIDVYTDSHAVPAQSRVRLQPFVGKFAGVVADIAYDHFLAANWQDYAKGSLAGFARHCYHLVEQRREFLPQRAAFVFGHMRAADWLTNYARLDFLEKVFEGMSRRTPSGGLMLGSMEAIRAHYGELEQEFRLFFPDLTKASGEYLQTDIPSSKA
jgi:acyl carrier protein phosphodiesterase